MAKQLEIWAIYSSQKIKQVSREAEQPRHSIYRRLLSDHLPTLRQARQTFIQQAQNIRQGKLYGVLRLC